MMKIIAIIICIVVAAGNAGYCIEDNAFRNNLRNPVIFGQETAERPSNPNHPKDSVDRSFLSATKIVRGNL